MNAWWLLPKAAPVLLRHLIAYAELASADLQMFRRRTMSRLVAWVVALVGAWFTLAMVCIAVVAAWWDTPHRMSAIFWLLGGFVLLTVLALLMAMSRREADDRIFSRVGTEWAKDRLILDRLLRDDETPSATAAASPVTPEARPESPSPEYSRAQGWERAASRQASNGEGMRP